ncbi:MAG TPA: phage holin family protein [Armatimonadota bacterium]|nr:phage holin family protein [Armatimonadota bacterium]
MRWLLRFLLSALALYLTSLALNDLFTHYPAHMTLGGDMGRDALAVLGLGLVNSLVRPVVRFFSLPLTFISLGLWGLIVNAALFWAVGHYTGGYQVGGVVGLLLGPIFMGFISGVLNFVLKDRREKSRRSGKRREE